LVLRSNGWDNQGGETFFVLLAQINLLLMVFNLIPLGPLDGHYILPHLLPNGLAQRYRVFNAQYGTRAFLILIVLAIVGVPIFQFLLELSIVLLGWITFV
jgi:Zn-dependent protease